MELTGYLGKKVDVKCGDKLFSGFLFDIIEAEDSGIGEDCIELSLIDQMAAVEIALKDITEIKADDKYIDYTSYYK